MSQFNKYLNYFLENKVFFEGLFLLSQYTIGFELEAIAPNASVLKQLKDFTNKSFSNTPTIKVGNVDSAFIKDETITKETETGLSDFSSRDKEVPFEYKSPIFNMTPENIKKIINYLQSGVDKYFSTNSSCGFHIHIGIPKSYEKDIDAFWVLCQLTAHNEEDEFNKKISRFVTHKNFDFKGVNQEIYASLKPFTKIKQILSKSSKATDKLKIFKNSMSKIFEDDKYVYFRIHPQGTLEWRGPREFIKGKSKELVKEFFFDMLIPLVKTINDYMELNVLKYENFSITKKQFNEIFSSFEKIGYGDKRFHKSMNKDDIKEIMMQFSWLKEAKFRNARIEHIGNKLYFNGTWLDGTWFNGVFNGDWLNGKFLNGEFNGKWMDGVWFDGVFDGKWMDGVWNDGLFKNDSNWMNGKWKGGTFHQKATWYDGIWYHGIFKGTWKDGKFLNGLFKGKWLGGKFVNGSFEGKLGKGVTI